MEQRHLDWRYNKVTHNKSNKSWKAWEGCSYNSAYHKNMVNKSIIWNIPVPNANFRLPSQNWSILEPIDFIRYKETLSGHVISLSTLFKYGKGYGITDRTN